MWCDPQDAGAVPCVEIERFRNSKRILIFLDMSTECDDECALLWLLQAINKRRLVTTIDLVMTDSQVRYQWMSYLFKDKFLAGNDWEVRGGGSILQVGYVLINLFLAPSPEREGMVINDIKKKAPGVQLMLADIEEGSEKRTTAVRTEGALGGDSYTAVSPGPCDSIVVAGAIPDVQPEFFERFTGVRCTYVVGTPGGINCPMPSWVNLLAAFHKLGPVLYLTPQFTRSVRFPTQYVLKNQYWNNHIRRTVFDATLTCMARRPELPPAVGSWGLVLRLNFANATFCSAWFKDVMGMDVSQCVRNEKLVKSVEAYVDRNSGDDRKPGAVVNELKALGVVLDPQVHGEALEDIDLQGQPKTPEALEVLRKVYREHLFEQTFICVMTAETLIFQNKRNFKVKQGKGGFETLQACCGYVSMSKNLAELYGADSAIEIIQTLPLERLTPAYDVVSMMCAVSGLDGKGVDDLGLAVEIADRSMGLELLAPEQRAASDHPILMTSQQSHETLEENVQRLSSMS